MHSEKCPFSVVRKMVAAFARCQRSETPQEVDGIELGKCPKFIRDCLLMLLTHWKTLLVLLEQAMEAELSELREKLESVMREKSAVAKANEELQSRVSHAKY